MEFPPAKRQDQDKAHTKPIISTAETTRVSREPQKIYPLRISPSAPARRVTNAMTRSVNSAMPATPRQSQIKRLYEAHPYNIHEVAASDWDLAIKHHQAAHFEDKQDYLNHENKRASPRHRAAATKSPTSSQGAGGDRGHQKQLNRRGRTGLGLRISTPSCR